ncbi:MAG: hypothetical protein ABF271_07085 [Abyssibacter sp.]|uniref:hypothetical protein n=1 Tax=Abyssibacter sp. TaxID=2320200 RepID=UPI003219712F
MNEWDSMRQTWQQVDTVTEQPGQATPAPAVTDRLAKRVRWVRWYIASEMIGSPFALLLLAWAWTRLDHALEYFMIALLGLSIIGYWCVVIAAYRRQQAPLPVRPWAIRARMLAVSRFWLAVCRAATVLFLLLIPLPLLDLALHGLTERWPYLAFSIGWALAWIVACQWWARRLWQRSRAYCIGPARQAPYRIF